MAISGKAFDFSVLKRILSYITPYRKRFILVVALIFSLALLSPVRPWLIQFTTDNYITSPNPEKLLLMIIILISILLLESILQFFDAFLTSWLGQQVIKDIRMQLYHHILNLRLHYFDNTPIGTLVTRMISDIETIAETFSEGFLEILGDILKITVIILVMFITDWRLTLISLSTIPILLWATYLFKNAIRSTFHEVRTQVARLNAFIQEHITGMSIVQIFNREKTEMKKFMEINEKHKNAHIRSIWYYSIFFPLVEILSAVSIGLLVWWGTQETFQQTFTLGNIIAFIIYINMLFRPIRQLADRFNTMQMGIVSAERVFKLLDTQEYITNYGKTDANTIQGTIEFKNLWFAYRDEDWVLRDVSFSVNKGQTIALVGATGAGKSSIINLLNRFYEYNKGSICIDNVPIREYELSSLRRQIGVVLQDVFLFSDTIFNNITLYDPEITLEKVQEAAHAVGANDFIENLPGKYNYQVMERGAMLSVGQRQLVDFMRAYVYDPKILILDEATSSIDTASEKLIQHATEKLTQDRTSIIIAHRLATVQHADVIFVLDRGKIIEQGNHRELMNKQGAYWKLVELQFNLKVKEYLL